MSSILITPEEAEEIKDKYASICYDCRYATTMSRPWLEAGYVGCRANSVVDGFSEREIFAHDTELNFANIISRPFNWPTNQYQLMLIVNGCIDCPFFKHI